MLAEGPSAFGPIYILKFSCNFNYFIGQVSKTTSSNYGNTILAWILSAFRGFAVSGEVNPIDVPGQCTFQSGYIVPTTPESYLSTPNNQDWKYDTIYQALVTSEHNGGNKGILWNVLWIYCFVY
jgi:hypothetical protein